MQRADSIDESALEDLATEANTSDEPKREEDLDIKSSIAHAEELATDSIPEPTDHRSASQANPEKFLEEFNWHNYEEGIDVIEDGKLEEFEKLVKENFVDT